MSHSPKNKIMVSHIQKHDEQCFSDKTMNEECPTEKIPFLLSQVLCLHLQTITCINKQNIDPCQC
jgi:hypothetical protein